MANIDQKPENVGQEANEQAEVFKGQKALTRALLAIAAIAVIVVVYIYAFRNPGVQSANEAIAQADITLAQGNDSLALVQYQQVADNEGYDAANRAALQAAILLYDKKDYNGALEYLNKFSANESLVGAAAKSLEGDCYVNLQQYDKAVSCFDKAASISDDNALYTPLFLMKKATVLRELKNYADEAATYERIKNDYPEYTAAYRIDINKYIERAKAQK